MKIWDLSNSFNDTFLYIKFDITLLYIIEKGLAFASAFFWRRRRDSNSRAGFPTYALSRGASSPT